MNFDTWLENVGLKALPKEGEEYKRKGYEHALNVKVIAVTKDGTMAKIDTVIGTLEVSTAFLVKEYDKVT
ncbi:hypothetical protein [Exiguobacterium sp. s130]|uniref:hypothetical protein n=1 Tax=Exiguobacterium sp. s130 TaxID=2751190 RepID=UPI001BE69696|nr:hypothetical protein [Exiguobacterium sp. s130]